jgi:tellurite resistance protein TerC
VHHSIWAWIGFNLFVLAMLAVDLGLFNREAHKISVKEATTWTIVWVTLALTFNAGVYYFISRQAALEFLTGYLIEKALSVDNIFVFVIIFTYFHVPDKYQHRVLLWGILGALVMRGIMIGAGALLIQRFEWVIYIFGAFLVFTGIKMALQSEHSVSPDKNPILKLIRKFFPVSTVYHGQRFIASEPVGDGTKTRKVITPLLVVLIVIETTDLIFAVDSIPAIFAVTKDPFIVYTSNIFAILGLRALYFLLAGIIDKFIYLKYGLAMVLAFVGVKMLLSGWIHIGIGVSLGVVALVLAVSIIASLLHKPVTEKLE